MASQRALEQPFVGFTITEVAGDDDRIEIAEQADGVQLWDCVGGLAVG